MLVQNFGYAEGSLLQCLATQGKVVQTGLERQDLEAHRNAF